MEADEQCVVNGGRLLSIGSVHEQFYLAGKLYPERLMHSNCPFKSDLIGVCLVRGPFNVIIAFTDFVLFPP